jgi:hypothetical protein
MNNSDIYIVDEIIFDDHKRLVEKATISRQGGKDTKTIHRNEIIRLLKSGAAIYVKKSTISPNEIISSMSGSHSTLPLSDRTFIELLLYSHSKTEEPLIATEEKTLHDNLWRTVWAPVR